MLTVFVCLFCGYEYKEEDGDSGRGIPPGTEFFDLPDDWNCPMCGASREDFEEIPESEKTEELNPSLF